MAESPRDGEGRVTPEPTPRGVIVTAAGPTLRTVLHDFALPTFRRLADRWGYEVHAAEVQVDGEGASEAADGGAVGRNQRRLALAHGWLSGRHLCRRGREAISRGSKFGVGDLNPAHQDRLQHADKLLTVMDLYRED